MFTTRVRRSWAVVGVFSAVALISVIGAAVSNADDNFGFARLQGNDRYDTAKDIAIKTFGTSDTVVIASGETFPDALAAAYAAGLGAAPILLTQKGSLPESTRTAISTLKAKNAVIVGGTAAVGDAVEQKLKSDGLQTTRIAGANRYDTAVQVAKSGGADSIGTTGGPLPPAVPTAIVVSGESFADALAAGPASHAAALPILLTPQAGLAAEPKAFLGDEDYGIGAVLIVGGTSAVSQAVEDEIEAMEITVTRIAGTNRSDTAAKVADYAIENLEFSDAHVDLARGDGFADALAAASHSGKAAAPLLLTQDPNTLSSATSTWLSDNAETLKDGHIFGGTAAVSKAVEEQAQKAAGNTTGSTTSTSTSSTTSTTLPGQNTNQPGEPNLLSAVVTPRNPPTQNSTIITLNYDEAITCASVDANGSGYTLEVNNVVVNQTVSCSGTSALSVTMTPATDFTQSGTVTNYQGKVTSKVGGDGDTVKDLGGNAEPIESVTFPKGPLMQFASAGTNNPNAFLKYDQVLDCTSVSSQDYQMFDQGTSSTPSSQNPPVLVIGASCSGDTVTVQRLGSFTPGNFYRIVLANNAVVKNKAGDQEPAGDSIIFKVA
jgi:putative cell wall-binding protein